MDDSQSHHTGIEMKISGGIVNGTRNSQSHHTGIEIDL